LPDGDQLIVADIPLANKVEILPAQGWSAFPAAGSALTALFGIGHGSAMKQHGESWAQYDPCRFAKWSICSPFVVDYFSHPCPSFPVNNFLYRCSSLFFREKNIRACSRQPSRLFLGIALA
jgi:hypothetical protein